MRIMYNFNTNDYLVRIPIFIIFLVWFTKNIGHVTCTAICSRHCILDAIFKCRKLDICYWIWEMLIGLCFLFKKTTIIAMMLLFVQMSGTFLPLIILPEVTFQDSNPFFPTLEGQYIIKNIIIITAALVIGRTYLKVK